jgi:hypothetical protein
MKRTILLYLNCLLLFIYQYDSIKTMLEYIFDIYLTNRQNILNKKKEFGILKNVLQDYSINTIKYNFINIFWKF